ncbi:putative transcription factor WRKY family [Helianthus annuus]|nr:putative transcription factor WRKY family [Helianthus annuus]KAJ0542067.1 putative transcription factor WRKY family [Helianthus annuus]KAJ0887820.1 putative transcription factor WRKY family [Helianthus annuus]KAJ0892755.1 putative transcription factor WRKY family [Helianthus annuus]
MEEASTPYKKRLICELIRGRDSTKKLQNLLRRKVVDGGPESAEDLVMKILGSFSDSLSTLTSWNSGELCPVPAPATSSDGRTWNSGQSEKKPAVKDRRGCYKRRKTEDSRDEIANTIEDGFAWRKYGQKVILDAKFPRCYYRCTHKNEGCKALKQVQKLEDGSERFHITYYGSHTCQNINNTTQMFSDSEDLCSFLLNFNNSGTNHSSSSLSNITNAHITSSTDQEDDSNAQSDDYLTSSNHDTSSKYLWKGMIGNLEPSDDADIFKDVIFMDDFKFQ